MVQCIGSEKRILSNSYAPSTIHRQMARTVGNMNLLEVLVCLNDINMFIMTLVEQLEKVLHRLHDEGLRLSLQKCQFFQPSVTY